MEQNIGKKIIISVILALGVCMLISLIFIGIVSDKEMNTSGSSYSGGSSSSSYSGSSYSGSSYSGGSSSSSSSYKSKDPADYDSKGNYKPVESMTQEEKRQELIDILEDSIY